MDKKLALLLACVMRYPFCVYTLYFFGLYNGLVGKFYDNHIDPSIQRKGRRETLFFQRSSTLPVSWDDRVVLQFYRKTMYDV